MIGSLRFAVMPGGEDFEIHASAENRAELVEVFQQWTHTCAGMNEAIHASRSFGCSGTCIAHFEITWFSRRRVRVRMDDKFANAHLVDFVRVVRFLVHNPNILLNDSPEVDVP